MIDFRTLEFFGILIVIGAVASSIVWFPLLFVFFQKRKHSNATQPVYRRFLSVCLLYLKSALAGMIILTVMAAIWFAYIYSTTANNPYLNIMLIVTLLVILMLVVLFGPQINSPIGRTCLKWGLRGLLACLVTGFFFACGFWLLGAAGCCE